MKIFSVLLTALIVIFCHSVTQTSAQTKIRPVGNVIIGIGSDIVLQTSVNGKIPLFGGDGFREEYSHSEAMFQISTRAVCSKYHKAIIIFNIISQSDSKKIRRQTKEITVKRGEKKTFKLKVKLNYAPQRNYLTTVFYESEEANNE